MHFIALRMLTGDRAKYLGLVFTIAFASFLLTNQISIFVGIIQRTASQIVDVVDAEIWVMDPATEYVDEIKPLKETDLLRVRGVDGVAWAVRLFKGLPRITAPDGRFRQAILLGLDDATLVGAPHGKLRVGRLDSLREPDAIVIDYAGYRYFWPDGELQLGRSMEMNDRRVRITGIVDASAPFATFPVVFSRYSQAVQFVGRERNQLSFVLVKAAPGVAPDALATRIARETGLVALTGEAWAWRTMKYYLKNTGIPVNFGITIGIALVVGIVVMGQTFYLFTLENLRQFGALKAIGVADRTLVGMILLQALTVGAIGYSIGMGICAAFFEITKHNIPTRGLVVLPEAFVGVAAIVALIVVVASLLSIRRVLVLEPAVVFRA
ncbi:MAG: ABC transporter permease [Gammaproteobacteria bacterium]